MSTIFKLDQDISSNKKKSHNLFPVHLFFLIAITLPQAEYKSYCLPVFNLDTVFAVSQSWDVPCFSAYSLPCGPFPSISLAC